MKKVFKTVSEKYTSSLLAVVLLALLITGCGASEAPQEVNTDYRGRNLIKITTSGDFQAGELENLVVEKKVGDGALSIEDGEKEGSFLSAVYTVDDYEYLTGSWSAYLPDNTELEVYARYQKEGQNSFSPWFSWGIYSTDGRCFSRSENVEECINQDVVSGLQFRAVLRKLSDQGESPVLRQLAFSTKGDDTLPTYDGEVMEDLPRKVAINAPAYSQEIRQPSIADSICSPTSVSVMLNSRLPDLNVLPEEIALTYLDDSYGFGNWAFSASAMGQYGFNVYTQYGDLSILLQELARGNTCVMSVKYTPGTPRANMPHLEGSYGSTAGHLIAVIGYEWEGEIGDTDNLYIFSSDSYSDADSTSYRRYKWTELDECWINRAMYIASPQVEEGAPTAGIPHLECEIKEEADGIYRMYYQGEPLDLTDFTIEKTSVAGRGVLCYTIQGLEAEPPKETKHSIVYDGYEKSLANQTFFYVGINTDDSGAITFDPADALKKAKIPQGEKRKITIYAMVNTGRTYYGEIEGTSGA